MHFLIREPMPGSGLWRRACHSHMPCEKCLILDRQIKAGLDGEYLVDSVEQVFTQSGWTTTVECNGGKQGKAKAKAKKKESKPLKVVNL